MKFEFKQEEIDWFQKPHPIAAGKINGKHWKASFIRDSWNIHRISGDGLKRTEIKHILGQLERNTPGYIERVKARRTKLRRYIIYSGLAAIIIGTVSFLIFGKHRKKL